MVINVNGVCWRLIHGPKLGRCPRPHQRHFGGENEGRSAGVQRSREVGEITKDGHPRSIEITETMMVYPIIYKSSVSIVEVCPIIYKQWVPYSTETPVFVGQWK